MTHHRPAALLLCAALFSLLLGGCTVSQAVAGTADMGQLQKAMLDADSTLPEMISITGSVDDASQLFTYLSELPYEKVENFLLSYSATGKADEVAVVAVKNPEDVESAAESLRTHMANRIKLFQQYTPEEAIRAEKGIVFTKDQYAVLIICDDSTAVKTAFETFLSQE